MTNNDYEIKILKQSLIALIIISITGIVVGTIVNSEVIFFDGLFALFGVVTTLITLKASKYMNKKDDEKFPFGKDQIEPLIVFFQYLLLNVFLLIVLAESIFSILNGGHEVVIGIALAYLSILVIAVYFIVKKMKKIQAQTNSGLLQVELDQWEIELKKGIFTLISYAVSYLLIKISFDQFLPYIDPIVLIIFVLLASKETISKMIAAFSEMIGISKVSEEKSENVNKLIEQYYQDYNTIDHLIRIKKVGQSHFIEIDFLVDDSFKFQSIKQQDEIRSKIEKDFLALFNVVWINIIFTEQPKWLT